MKTENTILPAVKKRTEVWPYAIIGSFAIFIILVMVAVLRAAQEDTSLVASDYYEQELKYQEQINREIMTRQLDKFIAFSFDPAHQELAMHLPLDTTTHKEVSGTVHFYRPSDDKLDFRKDLKPDADGNAKFGVSDLKQGVWKVRVTWKEGSLEFFDETQITI